jgi:hypothetical protein
MILNKEQIQKLLSDVNSELDIFSLHNWHYPFIINDIGDMNIVINNIKFFLEDLIKAIETDEVKTQ